jgi:hypothetical protein
VVAAWQVNEARCVNDDERLASLRKNAEGYRDALREARPLEQTERALTDQSFVWQIGLMGAALVGLPKAIELACGPQRSTWVGVVAAIWVLGMLASLLGRVLSRELRTQDAYLSMQRIQAVETLLLRTDATLTEFGARLLDIMEDDPKVELRCKVSEKDQQVIKSIRYRFARISMLGTWIDVLYYVANGALAVGIVVLYWNLHSCLVRG